jgi:predicted acetyltransferase
VASVGVVAASIEDKAVVRRLVELYLHDFSEFDHRDVTEHGVFGYRYLDHYWTEADRHPFLLRVDGHWAGFAFVRTAGDSASIAEFFVLRKYRRTGVGTAAARALFDRFPGPWNVEQVAGNPAARAFWHQAIPTPFVETSTAEGWTQTFTVVP